MCAYIIIGLGHVLGTFPDPGSGMVSGFVFVFIGCGGLFQTSGW